MNAIARDPSAAVAATAHFPSTSPGALAPAAALIAPALLDDAARMFDQLGLKAFRAAVVDLDSLGFHRVWSMSDSGATGEHAPQMPLNSQFPGATATLMQLADAPANTTVVQRLSPRHWSFAWRLDAERAVVAEARYQDARAMMCDIDTALVRLVCDTGIHAGLSPQDDADDDEESLVWPPSRERRQRRRGMRQSRLGAMVFAAVSALLALWIAFFALPDMSGQSARQQVLAEKTMAHMLSVAMATGDYGEVQSALSTFESIGYFKSAAVTNPKQRVVSLANAEPGWRIGDATPAAAAMQARSLELAMGSEQYGKLWLISASSGGGGQRLIWTRVAALAAFMAAALAVVLLLWHRRRSRRSGD